jgi:hypothetical protein
MLGVDFGDRLVKGLDAEAVDEFVVRRFDLLVDLLSVEEVDVRRDEDPGERGVSEYPESWRSILRGSNFGDDIGLSGETG